MISPRLLAAALLATVASPATAQGVSTSMELEGRKLSVSPPEMRALSNLGREATGANEGAQDAALLRARETVRGRDARHLLAVYMLAIGRQQRDDALRAEALDVLLASELTSRSKIPGFLDMRAGIAFNAGDFEMAKTLWAQVLETRPDDPDTLNNLAQAHARAGDARGAADFLERATAARRASGQEVSERWYRQRLSIALQSGSAEAGIDAAHLLFAAYPTPRNRRDALVVYRQLTAPEGAIELDMLRMMRTMGALTRTDEFQRMAQLLRQAGLGAEAKVVLDDGVARGLLDVSVSPMSEISVEIDREINRERRRIEGAAPSPALADSLVGAGRYAEAAELYGAALAADGADPGELNTRLGMALVLAGQRQEAQAAFQAAASVTPALGTASYADLAKFWLDWLAQPTPA